MEQNPTFYNRATNNVFRQLAKPTNYIATIDGVLAARPDLQLDPNGLLTKLAVNQYNEMLKTAPLERPAVPRWFCGYVDTSNGELRLSDAQEIENAFTQISNAQEMLTSFSGTSSVTYNPDQCLEFGPPGSFPYVTQCIYELSAIDATSADFIDWSQSFYPIEDFNRLIDSIEATVGMMDCSSVGGTLSSDPVTSAPNVAWADIIDYESVNIKSWTQTVTVNVTVGGGKVTFGGYSGNQAGWPTDSDGGVPVNANPWVVAKLNSGWCTSTFEWMRTGQNSKPSNTVESGHIKKAAFEGWCPIPGNYYGFFVSSLARGSHPHSGNPKERSNISWVKWPGS